MTLDAMTNIGILFIVAGVSGLLLGMTLSMLGRWLAK